jgi:hypothetical protein
MDCGDIRTITCLKSGKGENVRCSRPAPFHRPTGEWRVAREDGTEEIRLNVMSDDGTGLGTLNDAIDVRVRFLVAGWEVDCPRWQ